MKFAIIGAGNMGGAIARGLAKNDAVNAENVAVSSPNNKGELDALKAEFPAITTSTNNTDIVKDADFIFLAIKPWLLGNVINEIKSLINAEKHTIVSIVAGATCQEISEMIGFNARIIRLIPNTAISIGESMTFIAPSDNAKEEAKTICDLFAKMGKAMIIEEKNMGAATALASCGIAFAMRYVRASAEGGVELGFRADAATEIVLQTVIGAAKLIGATGNHPEVEIDKVTTPGGITIKGLNQMEKCGFTNAVIEGLKATIK